ncbi:MAG: 2-succinyl-6-hydroxy-2,4-cyclohexadiene-1-carboxylate synthase [Alphaproteobacteria bacterium MarineAlpha2_Bin1]|nr:MAG: 2-succinyl-6-hydroxy-2,4-cyclohexadiene-1-carboxylate synthase [Alphaproteobacteria bacterium MarineAlpha2_Bin1]
MSNDEIRRRFVKLNNNFFHYLECGDGYPVILLHESPKSSFAHKSLINFLSRKYKVLALDTPGYGFSDPINKSNANISDFARLINQIISILKIEKFILYGNHTGASIAVEYGKLFPNKLSGLILESLPIFYKNETKGIIKKFFPPLNIKKDGSHLTSIWAKVEDQNIWFPWYDRNSKKMHHWQYPRSIDIHDYAMDFLRSGNSYRNAYSSAFRYNSFLAVKRLKTPVKFISIKSDILYPHMRRLPKLTKNQELVIINDVNNRMKVIDNSIKSFERLNTSKGEYKNYSTKKFLDIKYGQLYYQIFKNIKSNNPILFLIHDLPGSSNELVDLMKKLSIRRTVIGFDIPGVGNSYIDTPKHFNMKFFVKIFDNLISELGINSYDIYGRGFGGYLSLYLSNKASLSPKKVLLDRVKILTKKEKEKIIKLNKYNLNINEDGYHLLNTWKMIINSKIYFPWYSKKGMILTHKVKDFDPIDVHKVFISIFNNPETYCASFNKILNCKPTSFIDNFIGNILIIKDSINTNLSVDKNLNINDTKENITIKYFKNNRNLTNCIEKFLN